VRAALLTLFLGALFASIAVAQEPPPGSPPDLAPVDENPCIGPFAAGLRCPDLAMRKPYGLYAERVTKPGHTVLRAGNVIDSVGDGPAELRGRRIGPRVMTARQRIHLRGGGRVVVETGARLRFKFAHQNRSWWKFHQAARFELWRLDSEGRRVRRVRTGPKVAYCLRDLSHTRPRLNRSPRRRVYPACNHNRRAQRVTLGTSIGWADIYPPTYPEQWIDVTGLDGCFAYVHIADPENRIYELNEDNNEAQVVVRLPFRPGERRGRCKGRDRGRSYDPYGPY
jgi:Lysyl oxidase